MDAGQLKKRLELEKLMGVDALLRPRGPGGGLLDLEREVSGCVRCRLHQGRARTVVGRGSPNADLMFIGEAPGREEDRQGLPFVGPAGKLLDRMIFAMGLRPEDVYIGNIIKCRPPDNRDPRADEIEACFSYLERQIEMVRPRIICTLGRPASNTILGTDSSMGALRGEWRSFRGIPVLPTYHPAYLLRSPAQKKKAWQDLRKVIIALREGPPRPPGPAGLF